MPLIADAQLLQWEERNGKVQAQKIFEVSGQQAHNIYIKVNYWLIEVYNSPEEILKARLENEFLKGEVYHPNVFKLDNLDNAGLRYTFTLDIKDEKVRFTISNVHILHSYAHETDDDHLLEFYIKKLSKGKDTTARKVVESVNLFADSLLKSFETHLFSNNYYVTKEDW
ncbi:DUF4468 domain-containing protein [Chryseosolibacter indicus]|uniref:DUF4468 domain-containing protein n=1 Tax=Chryseosolibacter indicus TaxID=2782351 RepID=A0ABS5VM61_9BACT|nr:DUF4468 domain-containing protein [Chryseosolibacter indicus]MBT1701939.1 DUF4468 domain-containing protein [Chryseosolibacter indicus]